MTKIRMAKNIYKISETIIGTAIYFLTRAITQLPIGYITDKIKKDKDEIIILIAGIILMGFPYILYPLISTPMHYYILQFVFGLGVSLNIVNWRKLFAAARSLWTNSRRKASASLCSKKNLRPRR